MEKQLKNPLVSIIIPVYQAEDYIEITIESICRQTYKNIEIILVDDGSKDCSMEKAEKRLKEHKWANYKLYFEENKGPSKARNAGITAAQGEWIICIDSDDKISWDFIEEMVKQAELYKNADFVVNNYKLVKKNDRVFLGHREQTKVEMMKGNKIKKQFLYRKIPMIVPAILIRKEFLEKNHIIYDEEMRFSEDVQYIWQLVKNCTSCIYIWNKRYYYVRHENSTMTSSTLTKIYSGYRGMLRYLIKWEDQKEAKQVMARWVLGAMHSSAKILDYKMYHKFLKKISYKKWMRQLKNFPELKARGLSQIFLLHPYIVYVCCKRG